MAQTTKLPYIEDDNPMGLPVGDPNAPIPYVMQQPQTSADADVAPPTGLPRIGDETPLGRFSQPILPPAPSPQVETFAQGERTARRTRDEQELQKLNAPHMGQPGSSHPGLGGKILHGLATAGNIAGNILDPGAMSLIKGTDLYNEQRRSALDSDLSSINKEDLNDLSSQASTEKTNADTEYTKQRPSIEAGKVRQHLLTSLAPKGFSITDNPDSPGGFDIAEDQNSQGYKDRIALSNMHQATADKEAITSEIARNHYQAGTPEYAEAQRKLAQVDQRLQIAMQGLGLRKEGLDIRKQNTAASLYGKDLDGNYLPGTPMVTDDNGNEVGVGSKNAGHAITQQAAVGSFKDLSGSLDHTEQVLRDYFAEGGSLSDPRMTAAMSEPGGVTAQWVHGLVQSGMSPKAIAALTAAKQYHEQAGILRAATKGTASEAGAQRILDTTPMPGDSNEVALSKLAEGRNVIGRLTPGVSTVAGGLTVKGKPGNNAPSGAPKIGEVRPGDGGNYRFKGGDQYDQKNWEKVAK